MESSWYRHTAYQGVQTTWRVFDTVMLHTKEYRLHREQLVPWHASIPRSIEYMESSVYRHAAYQGVQTTQRAAGTMACIHTIDMESSWYRQAANQGVQTTWRVADTVMLHTKEYRLHGEQLAPSRSIPRSIDHMESSWHRHAAYQGVQTTWRAAGTVTLHTMEYRLYGEQLAPSRCGTVTRYIRFIFILSVQKIYINV